MRTDEGASVSRGWPDGVVEVERGTASTELLDGPTDIHIETVDRYCSDGRNGNALPEFGDDQPMFFRRRHVRHFDQLGEGNDDRQPA